MPEQEVKCQGVYYHALFLSKESNPMCVSSTAGTTVTDTQHTAPHKHTAPFDVRCVTSCDEQDP